MFEKYINQKQMRAYYTKEDITEYISKSTIVAFILDSAEKKCAIAFRSEGAVWRLLRDDPDLNIYISVPFYRIPLLQHCPCSEQTKYNWNKLANHSTVQCRKYRKITIETASGMIVIQLLTLNICGSVNLPKEPFFRIPSFNLG